MADFTRAFNKTGGIEGGYANNPSDRGGETYKGIARKFFPAWPGWTIVDLLKPSNSALAASITLQASVKSFFKAEFWDRFWGDQITNQEVADELYDTGVNMGVNVSVAFLQKALNALNLIHKNWPNLVVDGQFGPATFAALNAYFQIVITPVFLLTLLNCQQGSKYLSITENDETQEIFMRGWLTRVALPKSTI